jgi:arginine decarboxylase-like protein
MSAEPQNLPSNGTRRSGSPPWKIDDSVDLYHVNAWGQGYFSINEAGHVVVRPDQVAGARSTCTRWCRA